LQKIWIPLYVVSLFHGWELVSDFGEGIKGEQVP